MYSQPPAPVVLTWPDPDASIPSHSPPAYDAAQVPLVPVNYEFSPRGFNTLLLLPPPGAQNTRPQYHISVALNCMNPFSFITTVRRGASDTGPYVGEFEMGISTIPGTVVMADCQMKIKEAIRNDPGSRWTWRFRDDPTQHIRWQLMDSSTGVSNCFFASEPHPASTHVKIAQFKGAPVTKRVPNALLRPCCEYIQQGRPYLTTSLCRL
ncbi:hypothetical protein DFH08DRAFT_141907 [Mycena albidolilacea]|uniref:Uncharacterized protein n=1 Tax=Mycena albidolilacea TaxID=1033008 RepID=A0AAD7A4I1_9AGAR|nr:hypothetical protein DFH08DRAFT_141907 [Mycena albidolilacea]